MTDDKLKLYRLRVRYIKTGRLAYLGHLEVLGTINRSIRRSSLPFSVGNGFARRIRIQFSQALPVGASSDAEYYDLMLTERVEPEEALARLRQATPGGLEPQAVCYLPRKVPALEAWANRSAWSVELVGTGLDPEAADEAIRLLLKKGTLSYLRGNKPKTLDLTTTLVGWEFTATQQGLHLALDTRSTNDGALRPAVLIRAALEEEPLAAASLTTLRVNRVGQWHERQDGGLVEPLEFSGEC